MSEAVLHPYRFGADALSLSCGLEGVENESTPSGDLLLLEPLPRAGVLRIAATVRVSAGTFERVLPEDERSPSPVQVAVVVRSPSSRIRAAFPLADAGDSYAGTISIQTDELYSRISLTPVLVRSTSASVRDGFATHLGAILANGRSVDVLLDEPIAPPGGYLEIEFEDFRRSPNSLRQRNADRMFAIDTEGAFPKLWLNQSIDNLEDVMRSRARRGVPRRIRDATYDTVCCQVWTALISASLTELAASADDDVSEADAVGSLLNGSSGCSTSGLPDCIPSSPIRSRRCRRCAQRLGARATVRNCLNAPLWRSRAGRDRRRRRWSNAAGERGGRVMAYLRRFVRSLTPVSLEAVLRGEERPSGAVRAASSLSRSKQ